jgi:membrane protein YqaA with SNARE-associated domain
MVDHPPAPDSGAPRPAGSVIDRDWARRLTFRTIGGVVVLGILVGLAGAYLESHMVTASTWLTDRLGAAGLLAGVAIADTIISPLPPDLFLIVIAKGELGASWTWLVPLAGLASTLGGFVGSFVGRAIGTRWLGARARRLLDEQRPLLDRYGAWTLVLGALTPIPFSVTCWLAGMARLRPALIGAVCLLRVPRFVLYFLFIVHADRLGALLSS